MKDYWILQLALWVWVWFTYQKYFKSFDQKSGGLEKSNVAKGVKKAKVILSQYGILNSNMKYVGSVFP